MAKKGSLGGLGGKKRRPIDIAATMEGFSEKEAAIKDYLETGGIHLDPETTAWCAAFVNSALAQAGLPKAKNPLSAISLLNYGEPVLSPQQGDVAVFRRSDDPETPKVDESLDKSIGHAAFYEGTWPTGYLEILGGNQGDQAGYMTMDPDRLLGFRRPPGTAEPPQAQSLTATLPRELAAGVYRNDLSRGLNPAGTVPGLPGGLGGTITPQLEQVNWINRNMPWLQATGEGMPEAGLPDRPIDTTLWPRKRRY